MSFKCAKKIKKKEQPPPPPPLTKKLFELRIRKKHAESASAESKLRFCPPLECTHFITSVLASHSITFLALMKIVVSTMEKLASF